MLDPFRNARHDIDAAIEHAQNSFDRFPQRPCLDSPLRYFDEERGLMPMRDVLRYDDYSSWGQWRPGDLKPREVFDETLGFRGRQFADSAVRWLSHDGIPAIVIIDSRYGMAIADGRGRTSLAVGLKLPSLHVIKLVDCRRNAR